MFIINFLRFLFGSVVFTAKGSFPERFFNLCQNRNLIVWNVQKKDGSFTAQILAKHYKKLRPVAKKTHTKLCITKKCGFPFRTKGYKNRYGFYIGAVLFAALLYTLSMFVWTIDIKGNKEVDTKTIKIKLESIGIKAGAFKGKIIPSVIEQSLMLEIPKISRVAIIQKGSAITVEVREGMSTDIVVPSNEPCHLLAARAGVLEKIEAYTGQAVKKSGEAVTEGDIVISGIVEDSIGNSRFKHASGKITAKTERTIIIEEPYKQQMRIKTGETKTKKYLELFALNIPLSFSKTPDGDYNKIQKENRLYNLPIMLSQTKYELVKIEEVILTEEQAREKAEKTLRLRVEKELNLCTIISQNVQSFAEIDKYKIVADYKCTENIAVEQKILIN